MATNDLGIIERLHHQFSDRIALEERRPGLLQLFVPLYHEDGDMLSIFLQRLDDGQFRISDMANTLMRLSYSFDLNSANKERIFQRILAENGVTERAGILSLDTPPDQLYPALMQFAQTVAKVTNMSLYSREVVKNLFYELLEEFVMEQLAAYRPRQRVYPIEDHTEFEVDYELTVGPRPLYLFGVKDESKAKLVTISCLQFQLTGLPFASCAVHQSFDDLARRDRALITNAVDKQFATLDDFQRESRPWLERQAA